MLPSDTSDLNDSYRWHDPEFGDGPVCALGTFILHICRCSMIRNINDDFVNVPWTL